jgi:hypothetical protein
VISDHEKIRVRARVAICPAVWSPTWLLIHGNTLRRGAPHAGLAVAPALLQNGGLLRNRDTVVYP